MYMKKMYQNVNEDPFKQTTIELKTPARGAQIL